MRPTEIVSNREIKGDTLKCGLDDERNNQWGLLLRCVYSANLICIKGRVRTSDRQEYFRATKKVIM